ncbi:GNAT family N-acetyltransferase [uncultured Amnibacterium sp.]|uniref:GNAT family N-acetyltransferase n=1 Tax=uncultured Amnibacterium sp. TaxID=1631851 RepID=UPI0035CA9F0A
MLDLRPARLDDPDALLLIDEVQRYYVGLYGGEDHDPIDADEFIAPHGRFLLGSADGEPVAMGGWSFLHGSPADAKVRRMYVRPQAQRRGFAGALLEALEQDARAAGAERTVLATGLPQADAIAFYRSRGYTDIPPFGFYADEVGGVFLAKPL